MQHSLTLKHVQIKPFFRNLVEELLARLEEQTATFGDTAVFTHVVIEQNKARTLFRVSLNATFPRKTLAVHEEGHDAVKTVREAFDELERQLNKFKAKLSHEHRRKQSKHKTKVLVEPPAGEE